MCAMSVEQNRSKRYVNGTVNGLIKIQ